jgi:hypothetical protein
MRVLLLLGEEWGPQGRGDAQDRALTAALRSAGVAVERSRAVNPDLDGCDLVHLLATPPSGHAARQFIHARRWGQAIVLSPIGWNISTDEAVEATPPPRYEAGLRDLLARGAERIVLFDEDHPDRLGGYVATEVPRVADPAFGAAVARVYATARQEYRTMARRRGEDEAGRWLPALSSEDYGRHLEDLVQLQLELIAYRDAEYEHLRRQLDQPSGQQLPADDYARLEEWSRDLAARHETLQADYERLQRWAGEMEAQLRAAGQGHARASIARLLRRR